MPTNGKKPLGCQWQQRSFTPKALQQQLAKEGKVKVYGKNQTCYEAVPTGIALLCGQNEREFLIAVDCDGQSAFDQIEQIAPTPLPSTVAFTSGRASRAQYLFKIPSFTKNQLKSRKIRTAANEALELRAANLASVLPPSIHPTTGQYRWLPGCRPDEIEVAVAPDWIVEQMSVPMKTRSPSPDSGKSRRVTATPSDSDLAKALLLLEVIQPKFADNYDSWLRIGMALKSISPCLLPAWDSWSQLSSKYKKGECQYKWDSFRQIRTTIGTLYYFANFD
ncbi:bifunctional DNA primase/polymerase [Chroococcidiopsis sp. SAG 2025]|uniref:bifunctional DNA primase/polymerase n=1 Tax=Chroococcidiopsis sp. SAG 2025 TaxID=171389 RepID=UPI0039776A40